MIYHLVLEEEHGVLLLRLGHRRLSTTYALGPGPLDAQWHDMNDADMEGILKDEESRYGTPCTGVNLNGMNHTVYILGGVGLCMASTTRRSAIFFSMNLFRCLDFADLEDFLYHVRHVYMIQRIQVAWKGGGTPIAKRIHRLQKSATGLAELRLMVGKEDSEAMLTQPFFSTGVSTDLNVTYLNSGGKIGDTLRAEVTCATFRKTLVYTDIRLLNSKDELVAKESHTK